MPVRKFALADAAFERSPGQDSDIFAANMIDQRHGGPITIGFGRYGPNQRLGVRFRFQARATRLHLRGGRITGVGSAPRGTGLRGPHPACRSR